MKTDVRFILNKGYNEKLDADEVKTLIDYIEKIETDNEVLEFNNKNMQEEMIRTWEKLYEVARNKKLEIKQYKFLSNIKDIIKNRDIGYMETCDVLETIISKELEKYE